MTSGDLDIELSKKKIPKCLRHEFYQNAFKRICLFPILHPASQIEGVLESRHFLFPSRQVVPNTEPHQCASLWKSADRNNIYKRIMHIAHTLARKLKKTQDSIAPIVNESMSHI